MQKYDKEQAINVQGRYIAIENVNEEFSYSGTFEPNKETKNKCRITGKINTILVDVEAL